MNKIIVTAACVGILSACGGGGGSDSSSNACSDLNLKVFGGEQCNFSRSPVVAIIGLSADGIPISLCSATMVTLDDALTAAHCSSSPAPGGRFIFANNGLHRIIAGANHPQFNSVIGSPYDVAMVTIEGALDIGPVPILVSDPIEAGESISIFGYGQNEAQDFVDQPSDFRAGYMQVSSVANGLIIAAFNSTGSAICQGDSGGPATQTVNGITSIVGVTSYTIAGCQEGSNSGFVNIQNPGIYEFINAYAPDVTFR